MDFSMDFNELGRYKKQIINIGIIMLFLMISFNIYKIQFKEINRLKQEEEKERRDKDILRRIVELDEKIKYYKDFVNKKEISSVMNKLNMLAKDSGIIISSLKPLGENKSAVFNKYGYQLHIEAKDYGAIGKFISGLESDPDVYIVNSIDMKPGQRLQSTAGKDSETIIDVDMQVSTVILN